MKNDDGKLNKKVNSKLKASKLGLQKILAEATLHHNQSSSSSREPSPQDTINYGRNFENYARNFENYARNFENYARNFENNGNVTDENYTYSEPNTEPLLPNGNSIPKNIEELLKKAALRKSEK
ncbi:hypothetical protein RFI10_000258 [Klebsiella aerogenes]|nr:hypothetical protein [Klebsiella aerogenes]